MRNKTEMLISTSRQKVDLGTKSFSNNIKKPSTPHIMGSQRELTQEERKKKDFAEKQLSELGISTSIFDVNSDGHEDPDVLKAIILANQGKTIPADLKKSISTGIRCRWNLSVGEEVYII